MNPTNVRPAPAPPVVAPHTQHLGFDDLPFVSVGDGIELQLLHVDLANGLWVNRTRLKPGASVIRHLHAGPVYAVTLQGRWFYRETPGQVNVAGSYLFEPAGSVHTLQAAADQTEDTIAWFAIWGPNINLRETGEAHSVFDARTALTTYRGLCAEAGLSTEALIVSGD